MLEQGTMDSLPLICVECWAHLHEEIRIERGRCARCGTNYPEVDGVPVLLSDPTLRQEVAQGDRPGNARSAFYQENAEYLREALPGRESLASYLDMAPAQGLVLEIGSGSGIFAGTGGRDYCALDYSLAHLRNFLRGRRRICASAEQIPLLSESCRFVLSVATLEHVPRANDAFKELHRVLVPDGIGYIAPAWHCRDWAADGLPVRPYRDLSMRQRVRKALIPLRDSLAYRGLQHLPWRLWRRARAVLERRPTPLVFRRIEANYTKFWMSDSDACSSIDSHEAILFFESRGCEIIRPTGGVIRRLLFRSGPLVIRKA